MGLGAKPSLMNTVAPLRPALVAGSFSAG